MEFKTETGAVWVGETLYDGGADILLEGEYLVPDYQSEIFRIIRSTAKPVLVQKAAVGQRASVEGIAEVTVLYQGAESGRIAAASFKIPFSRQFELERPVSQLYDLACTAEVPYFSCNAVSPRRLQARGTLRLQMKLLSYEQQETASALSGPGAQQLARQQSYWYKTAESQLRFSLDETLEMSFEGCETPAILRCEAYLQPEKVQLEQGRVAVGGAVLLSVTADVGAEQPRLLHSGYELPFYQLFPNDVTEEDAKLCCSGTCVSVALTAEPAQNLLEVSVGCQLELGVYTEAAQQLLEDAFSTLYEVTVATKQLPLLETLCPFTQDIAMQAEIQPPAGSVLLDWGVSEPKLTETEEGSALTARFFCLLQQPDGGVTVLEAPASVPFVGCEPGQKLLRMDAALRQVEAAAHPGEIRLYVTGKVFGVAAGCTRRTAVCGMRAEEDAKKPQSSAALCLYYTDGSESVWELAKRFNTCADVVQQENARLENDATSSGVLLIPMVEGGM